MIERIEFYVLDRLSTQSERGEIEKLVSEYGYAVVNEAVTTAIRMEGHSVKYLRKCAETAAVRKTESGQRYEPTYDIAEIERQLDAEWADDDEEGE